MARLATTRVNALGVHNCLFAIDRVTALTGRDPVQVIQTQLRMKQLGLEVIQFKYGGAER